MTTIGKGRRLEPFCAPVPYIETVLGCNERIFPTKQWRDGCHLPLKDFTYFETESSILELPKQFRSSEVCRPFDTEDLWIDYWQSPDPKGPRKHAPFMQKLDQNGLTIVKLCGARSAAAAVVMDHAVLSWRVSLLSRHSVSLSTLS